MTESSERTLNTRYESLKRALVRVFPVIALVWLLGCAALYHIMRQPPETFARFMAKLAGTRTISPISIRDVCGPTLVPALCKWASPAPDFSLTKLDKSASVQLSSLTAQGQPVVLIFGSYT